MQLTTTETNIWKPGPSAWDQFTNLHPELGYPKGRWGFHNFLRNHKEMLCQADAIRLARNKFWIAHQSRFNQHAFALATGRPETLQNQDFKGDYRCPQL